VAEFFKTISSITVLIVSLWGHFLCFKYGLEARFYLCWLGIGVVGIGSVAFHGTLHPTGGAGWESSILLRVSSNQS
jgi:dihydroceramidase